MKITKSMRKMPYPELRGSLAAIKYPAMAEIKFDGEFNWLIHNGDGEPYLINKNGKIRSDCYITKKALELSEGRAFKVCGELFYQDGKMGKLYDLLSATTDVSLISFFAFDIAQLDSQDTTRQDLLTRMELLAEIMPTKYPGKMVNYEQEAMMYFSRATLEGYEGIVLKSIDSPLIMGPCSWVKLKYKDQNDYMIVDVDPVLEKVNIKVKTEHKVRTVGVKVPNKYKHSLKAGDMITVEHQGVLSGGGLRHPVFKGKVGGGEIIGVTGIK